QALVLVAEAGQAVLAPAVGAAGGGVVGEVAPGVAAGRVVLADGAPLPVADVGPPPPPGRQPQPVLLQPLVLRVHRLASLWSPPGDVVGCRLSLAPVKGAGDDPVPDPGRRRDDDPASGPGDRQRQEARRLARRRRPGGARLPAGPALSHLRGRGGR